VATWHNHSGFTSPKFDKNWKVDETNRNKYIEAGSAPFKPFSNRPTMRSFYEIPPDIFESPEELIEWSEESLAIQKKGK